MQAVSSRHYQYHKQWRSKGRPRGPWAERRSHTK